MDKTMVMKILEKNKITYKSYQYFSNLLDAVTCSKMIGKETYETFKTLVTIGNNNSYYVFMIPSDKELDLKKCAKLLGIKKLEMIPQKDLEPLTGYVHGGCSPIGMKKKFPTYLDISATQLNTICYSAGKIGCQVETSPNDLIKLLNIKVADLTKENDDEIFSS